MKWILRLVVFVVVLAAVVFVIGLALPAHTTHTRVISLAQQPPAKVFAALADISGMAKWNRNTEKIEMLPPVNGRETSRQTFKGGTVMTVTTSESSPPNHLVRTLGDEHSPFIGSWTYQIWPEGNGSRVALTEDSQIRNPFFRLMIKVFGPTKYMDEHLEDLATHFGESAVVH